MDLPQSVSYHLDPGYIFFSRTPTLIRTVVGSCVAVCLWDQRLQYGGANHFLRPATREKEAATPQFGNVAMAALIKIMEEAGCRREDIIAQIFGGASPDGKQGGVGEENVQIAREILEKKGIKIVAEDIGGSIGRKIVFDTSTGQLAVMKVHKLRSSDWM